MTAPIDPRGDTRAGDDDALLADLFDRLLQDVLDGRTPDPASLLPDRPDLKARVRETFDLACAVAGRREPSRPVLGGYEIVRELGRGGMGTVYLARHEALSREVAIKVLPQSLALSARAKRRFLEEARALARLRHEHIVHIHRIVDHGEMLAFEMEYVEGPSLQSLLVELRRHGPRPQPAHLQAVLGAMGPAFAVRSTVEYFVRLGIAIARALAEVHRRGLVHRDVKPSNILLRNNGTPVLADFGLAQEDDPSAPRTVSFAGTPIYAAPERLRHGDLELDGRADVYSLGVTLYEAITLSPPYQGRTTEELLRKIESGHLVPLRQRAPHVSRDLQTVLQKAMEADPRHRYATADAFADDLERLLTLQPIEARPKSPLRRFALALTRHRKVLAAGAAGAVLVALAVWPVVASARDAATANERAATIVRAAHRHLLAPECIDLDTWGPSETAGVDVVQQATAMRAAIAAYDEALQVTPDDPALQAERAVSATALWLRDTGAARGTEPAPTVLPAVAAALPPLTATAARQMLDGGIDLDHLRAQLESATPADHFTLGLLAALLGERALCEAAWLPLDGGALAHPLLDAGLGRLYAADGYPERAYPLLFHATRAFPGASALALELADAALATGDVRLAEQWLEQAVQEPDHDAKAAAAARSRSSLRRQRLAADLLAAKGDRNGAETAYRLIVTDWPRDVQSRHRLATLAIARGDLARARLHLQRILADRPDHAPSHLDLARIALHLRDRPAYLAEVRSALARHRSGDRSRSATGQLLEILRLGGLHGLLQECSGGGSLPMRDWRHVEPAVALWRHRPQLTAIEAALRVLADLDWLLERLRAIDSDPMRLPMRTAACLAARHGEVLRPLPPPTRAALAAAWPYLVVLLAEPLTDVLVPLRTSLGTPLQLFASVPIATGDRIDAHLDYARTIATVGFADGTEDLLVAAVPRRDSAGGGFVEVRAATGDQLRQRLEAPRPGLMFGYALADVGDLDGDGSRDFAVGAPQSRPDPQAIAAVFVYSGRDRTLLRELRGTDSGFGVALCALGDVDGDTVGDFAVGAVPFRKSALALGTVTVFSGRSGAIVRVHQCDRAGAWFGGSVAAAGDLDGDDVQDLLVGGNLGGSTPHVRAYSGSTGKELLAIDGDGGGHDFGRTVLGVGDMDGDGVPDLAITAPGLGSQDHAPGRVLFYSGRNGRRIAEARGEVGDDHFGAAICILPDWCGDRRPAIAIGATRGGVCGNGYVRVFDRARLVPLQSFFLGPLFGTVGAPIACLSEHQSRERPRLAVVATRKAPAANCANVYAFWFSLDRPQQVR